MPARSEGGRIVAAIEVIGPTRINFDQINPDPDHVGRVISRLLGRGRMAAPRSNSGRSADGSAGRPLRRTRRPSRDGCLVLWPRGVVDGEAGIPSRPRARADFHAEITLPYYFGTFLRHITLAASIFTRCRWAPIDTVYPRNPRTDRSVSLTLPLYPG
jgi:hypothetical protein